MNTHTTHTLPPTTPTKVVQRWGMRIFTLSTSDGRKARVIDPLTGVYAISFGQNRWRTTTPPPGLFGGA